MLSAAEVVRASNAWVWVPDDAETVETADFLLVRFPDHYAHRLELVRFAPEGDVDAAAAQVVEAARGFDVPYLVWRVRLDAPPGTDEWLTAAGGTVVETVEVFALDLSGPLPERPEGEIDLRWRTDQATARDAAEVTTSIFGGAVPAPEELRRSAERDARGLAVGRGGALVAYVDGRPVGTGGLSSRGAAAGLWGGAVVPEARGRGVYRALLAERLRYAADHAMTMALVKGRVESSGPILRRAGFTAYGRERSYRLDLASR